MIESIRGKYNWVVPLGTTQGILGKFSRMIRKYLIKNLKIIFIFLSKKIPKIVAFK
jgi:hypothetical protein